MVHDATEVLEKYVHRKHLPKPETAAFLFAVYQLLLKAPTEMDDHAKKRAFENAADGSHSWKVVCITEAALRQLVQSGEARGLRRAHALSRQARFTEMFDNKARKWTCDELIEYFFEHDICALVTSDENKKHTTSQWSKRYEVPETLPWRNGVNTRTFPGSFSVYARKTLEIPWATDLLKSIDKDR